MCTKQEIEALSTMKLMDVIKHTVTEIKTRPGFEDSVKVWHLLVAAFER